MKLKDWLIASLYALIIASVLTFLLWYFVISRLRSITPTLDGT